VGTPPQSRAYAKREREELKISLKKFQCLKCGSCCKASHISLLPHELTILKRLAEKLRTRLEVGFDYTVYDKRSNSRIVLTYYMMLNDDNTCPFLTDDNLCSIHYIYKPLVCRAFPYVPSEVRYFYNPYTKTVFHKTEFAISYACPVIRRNKALFMSEDESSKKRSAIFLSEQLKAAREFEEQRTRYVQALSYLWKIGLVDLEFKSQRNGPVVNAYTFIRQFIPYFVFRKL